MPSPSNYEPNLIVHILLTVSEHIKDKDPRLSRRLLSAARGKLYANLCIDPSIPLIYVLAKYAAIVTPNIPTEEQLRQRYNRESPSTRNLPAI